MPSNPADKYLFKVRKNTDLSKAPTEVIRLLPNLVVGDKFGENY